MAKILLLDDSAVMHRVVRLTFANDSQKEIAVARTPAEVDQVLSAGQVDLIIAYVRFSGVIDPRYFEALSFASPRILLLAEGEENLDDFIRAGFKSILRKPFHSDELRQAVEDLLQKEASGRSAKTQQFRNNSNASFSPAQSSESQFDQNDDTIDFSTRSALREQQILKKEKESEVEEFSNEPKITMDLSFLESTSTSLVPKPPIHVGFELPSNDSNSSAMSGPSQEKYTPERNDSAAGSPRSVKSNQPAESPSREKLSQTSQNASYEKVKSSAASSSLEKMKQSVAGTPLEKMFNAPRASASVSQRPRAVEPSAWDSGPMMLENVIVNKLEHEEPQSLSRQDVERIVEDAVAIAVTKAVRQALNETLPDLRQGLVNEVSQRALDQLNAELFSLKKTLRESMVQEIREVSAQWLRRETPLLAKDVIREEIRKVIESVNS